MYVQGATTNTAESSAALMELFDLGSKNRHVASTSVLRFDVVKIILKLIQCTMVCVEMNAESSRSHLIIGIVLESTNLSTGTVHKGKVLMPLHD